MGLPKCFVHIPGAFRDLDFTWLAENLAWEQKMLTMYGRTFPLPRLTTMYGEAYTYSGVHHPAREMPAYLKVLQSRVESESGLTGFNSVLGNLYEDGSHSVGWHSDDDYNAPPERPHIASVSVGATRRFRIRSKADKHITHSLELGHGDLLLMVGDAQKNWMHTIPRTSRKVGPRINLTFRCMETT